MASKRLGLASYVHAAKLPAWIARLDAATGLLVRELQIGDVEGIVRQVEDVGFWTGRLLGDLLAIKDSPAHNRLARRALRAVVATRGPMIAARRYLATATRHRAGRG